MTNTILGMDGNFFAYLAAALTVLTCGVGSCKGLAMVSEASTGVLAEDPDKFGVCLIMQALPSTNGIYGFLIGFIVMLQTGMLDGTINLSLQTGLYVFAACLPMIICGPLSGIYQARSCVGGVGVIAKRPDQVAKPMILAAMIETYSILSLLVSMLMLLNIPM